ncbi:hypothetical protein F4780DRAFT_765942 [Xylariomycetidae sp. FL0641]|nr:hypothetical protein F4780DRAFT_765942 [Xylariomycetidae sp. FL0641]
MSQNAHRPGDLPGLPSSSQSQPINDSSNDSQATSASNDADRVFTPPESDSEGSTRHANGNTSSQSSQLMQLSQLAAAQQKMASADHPEPAAGQSRKRTADGTVKHERNDSATSPVRTGHSRNTSAVSMASTAGSRLGEMSAELRTKLSYAMVKVNNGWQGRSIDEVESLASRAASPTSSNSTLHGRHGTSASPRMAGSGARNSASTAPSAITSPSVPQPPPSRTFEPYGREGHARASSLTSPGSQIPTLAPPAPIQPRQLSQSNPPRYSNARYTPAYLGQTQHASPHSPAQPSLLQSTPGQRSSRTPNVDPIQYSPHQLVREQEALETLLFMSSPGNSGNMKHTLPPSQTSQPSQPAPPPPPPPRSSTRTALPTSRLAAGAGSEGAGPPRKSLPTGRPQGQQTKRVGFEKSPSMFTEMEIDSPYASPQVRSTPRRKTVNGAPPKPTLSVPAGLSAPARNRRPLREEDIERMLDRVAADDSSDSEGEIQIPRNRNRDGAGVGI